LEKQSSRIVGTSDKHSRCSCGSGGNRKQLGHSEKLARILSLNATAFLPGRVVSTYASAHLDLIPGWPQRLFSCPDDAPRDGENILRLACGLVEQLIEFARRELAAPAIRNANSASGCFELAGFGDRDYRIDSVRLAASTVF
jgi:hypothetical protein